MPHGTYNKFCCDARLRSTTNRVERVTQCAGQVGIALSIKVTISAAALMLSITASLGYRVPLIEYNIPSVEVKVWEDQPGTVHQSTTGHHRSDAPQKLCTT